MATATHSPGQMPIISGEIANAEAHLVKHLRGRLVNASLSVYRGGIIIHGRTRSFYVKQLAQHAVMQLVSLPIAANQIEVQGM